MQFRHAIPTDAPQIAALHALSWQQTYRGILNDEYLDNDALPDRLEVWRQRLTEPAEKQWIWLAVYGQQLQGFICVLGDHDPVWGALVDNLHVHPDLKGQGLGARLMRQAAHWIKENCSMEPFYLWVYEENAPARMFYEKLGGVYRGSETFENPGGGQAQVARYAWASFDRVLR